MLPVVALCLALLAGFSLYGSCRRSADVRIIALYEVWQQKCLRRAANANETCQQACGPTGYECAKTCMAQFNPVLLRCNLRGEFSNALHEVYSVGAPFKPGALDTELERLLSVPNPCRGALDQEPLVVRVTVSSGKALSVVLSGESDPAAQLCIRERLARHAFKQAEDSYVTVLARTDDPPPAPPPKPKKAKPQALAAVDTVYATQADAGTPEPARGKPARIAGPARMLDVFDLPGELRGMRGKPLVVLFYSHEGFAHEPLQELRRVAAKYGEQVQIAAYGPVPAEQHAVFVRFAAAYSDIIDAVQIITPDPKKGYFRETLSKISLEIPEGQPIKLPLYAVYDASGTLVSRGQNIFNLHEIRIGLARAIPITARR